MLAHAEGRLIGEYRKLHALHFFPGMSIAPFLPDITELVAETGAKKILDYGCGEGVQYTRERFHEAWGVDRPALYDPGVARWADKPVDIFDGVICTDVLEHVPEDELDGVIDDLIRMSSMWVFASVCCRPAKRKFLDGTNVHVTIRPLNWWAGKLARPFGMSGRRLVLRETP